MKVAIQTIDLVLTGLILWSHFQITFWINSSIPTWTIGVIEVETSEFIRKATDLLIMYVLSFHFINVLLGKWLWSNINHNKWLNFFMIGLLFLLSLPYLKLWFLYFHYANIVVDLVRTGLYIGLILVWLLSIVNLVKPRRLINP